MTQTKKIIIVLVLVIVGIAGLLLYKSNVVQTTSNRVGADRDEHGCIGSAGYSWCDAKKTCIRPWEEYCTATPPKTAVFNCVDSKAITAAFYIGDDTFVDLVLSDGRKLSVPHAVSASGARYAKADESFVFWNKGDTAFITEGASSSETFSNCVLTPQAKSSDANAGMANPASANCVAKGGTLEMRTNTKGQYGVCLFEDNRQCEEWALLRGECPVGGLKITGYDNDAEIYCAITGGIVEGVGTKTPMCKRIDGTYCNAEANLNGDCPDPHDPNPSAGNVEAP